MRLASLFVAVFLYLFCTVATAAPEGAGKNAGEDKAAGFITGRVTDSAGAVPGALAEAFACTDWSLVGSAKANDKGDYTIGPLSDGCYHVRFADDRYESAWAGEEGGREAATDLDVDSNTVSGIDSSLAPAGSTIAGKVKGPDGKGLAGAWVAAIRWDDTGVHYSDARAGKDGSYLLRVSPGKYVILFSARGHVSKVHGTMEAPTPVEAVEGKKASGIDASLVRGGSITGSVTDQTGNSLSGIYVIAYGQKRVPGSLAARTDSSGRFVLDGVPSGSYRVSFADRERKYVVQWYGGTANVEAAVQVTVTAPGETSGIRGVLKPAGGISGMITDPSGNGVAGAFVIARGAGTTPDQGGGAVTDETGAYTIGGLASGSYLVAVNGSADSYAPLFYRDAIDEASATLVEVSVPQITYGIDQVIRGASLAGTVRNEAGTPIPKASVIAYRPGGKGPDIVGMSSTDPSGAFSFSLPDGEYLLEVNGRDGGYLSQWSGGRATREEATRVAVTRKEGITKVDVVLTAGGAIAGTVRNSAGAPIGGVSVSARDAVTGEREESAKSDDAGKYMIKGLRGGTFRLIADGSDVGYIREKVPQAVEVQPPAVTETPDIVMRRGGAVSGQVADREGSPLPWLTVTAYEPGTWDEVASATTSGTGAYTIGGLPEGKYRIRFDGNSKIAVQWYKGKSRREEAVAVEVAGTGTTTGINAVMVAGVPLRGTVTDTSGAPVADAVVEVYGSTEDEPFDKVHTDRAGNFAVPSLAAGNYRIRFGHASYVPQWYGGSDRRTAAPLAVGPETAPLAVSLVKGTGRFSGKLTNPEGQQIGQAWITAIDALTGAAVADERICECSGRFNTPVPAASYLLRVERHGSVTWFGGNTREEAVPVALFGDVGGLDMVIEDQKVRSGHGAATARKK